MGIKQISSDMKKSLVIMVGDNTDAINLHSACLLCDSPVYLKDLKEDSLSNVEHFYLLGHGNLKKCSIDKKGIDIIASKLMDAGYHGQEMELLSCDSGLFYKSKSMYSEFIRYFKSHGIESPKIICDAYGKTIITSTSRGSDKVGCWVVHDKRTDYAGFLQGLFLNKRRLKTVAKDKYEELTCLYAELFKRELIVYFSKDMRWYDVFSFTPKLIYLFGCFVSCLSLFMLTFLVGNTESVLSLISLHSNINAIIIFLVISALLSLWLVSKKDDIFLFYFDGLFLVILGIVTSYLFFILMALYFGGWLLFPSTIFGLITSLVYIVYLVNKV